MHYYKKSMSIVISAIFWNSFLPVLSLLLSGMQPDTTVKRVHISKFLAKRFNFVYKGHKNYRVPEKDARVNMIWKSSHIIGEKKWNRILIWVQLPCNLQHPYRLSTLRIRIAFANYNLFFPRCCLSLNFLLLTR